MVRITLESGGVRKLEWLVRGGSAPLSLSWRKPVQTSEAAGPRLRADGEQGSSPAYSLCVLGWLEIVGPSRR